MKNKIHCAQMIHDALQRKSIFVRLPLAGRHKYFLWNKCEIVILKIGISQGIVV